MLAAASDSALGETINIGSGREISIGDLTTLIGQITGRPFRVETDAGRSRPAASEVDRLLANNHKASTLLGWQPAVQLEDGLERTIDWIAQHMDRYRSGVYVV